MSTVSRIRNRTATRPAARKKPKRYGDAAFSGANHLPKTEKITPRPPASNTTIAIPSVDVMKSARRPMTRVLNSNPGVGVSSESA